MLRDDEDTRTGELRRRGSDRRPPLRLGAHPHVLANRYRIVDVLGAGGMGVVYEARDAELDREVAIKLLHPHAATVHARRLLREAQTLARLSHPNLVAVFDVGWAGDDLFVAMELVRGRSLATPPSAVLSWRENLRLLLEAGRGLQHAHECGLVHRDFKPANVLVGLDGRARVADFGLARPSKPTSSERGAPPESGDGSEDHVPLTRPGSNPGTPAYMPPELWHGAAFDERGDQFSFCVSAWEVLFGVRPDRDERTAAPIVLAPAGSSVPRFVRAALLRGMATSPTDRHASMRELLRALDPERQRLRSPALFVGLGSLLVAGLAYASLGEAADCDDIDARLYDDDTRATIRSAAEVQLPHMPELRDAIDDRLHAYAAEWTGLRREACLSRARVADLLFDRRVQCLEERREAARAVIAVLADAHAREPILAAPEAIAALPPLSACTDDEALLASPWQPRSSDEAVLAQRLQSDLGRVQALVHTGQLVAALPEADALLRESEALPASPLRAKVQLQWALLRREHEDLDGAFAGFEQAAQTAAAAHDDATVVAAWLELAAMLADDHARADEFDTVASTVDALAARLPEPAPVQARLLESRSLMASADGRPEDAAALALAAVERVSAVDDPLLLGKLQTTAGLALTDAGRYAEGIAFFEQAIASESRVLTPTHPRIASDLMNLSLLQDPDTAEATQQRAIAIFRAAFPDGHADLALALTNYGLVLLNRGAYAEAEAALKEALPMQQRAFPDGHLHTSHTLVTLADLYNETGRRDEALAFAEQGLALRRALLPEAHLEIGRALRLIGAIHFDDGDVVAARASYEEALAVFERTLPADHPAIAGALNGIGECAVIERDGARALDVCTRALAIERKARGEDALDLVPHLSCVASAQQELGRPELAVPLLEQALALWSDVDVGPLLPAQIRLQLATALDRSGGDRTRVAELAQSVVDVAKQFPDARGRLLEPAEQLLAHK